MNDPVNHPSHYTAGKVECIDAIESAIIGLSGEEAFNIGTAIKYLWRWKRKNGSEDLRKAQWYLNRLISNSEEEKHCEACGDNFNKAGDFFIESGCGAGVMVLCEKCYLHHLNYCKLCKKKYGNEE